MLESRLLVPLPDSVPARIGVGAFRLGALGLLIAIGVIHLGLAPTYGQEAGYIGVLFYATFGACIVAGGGIALGVRGGWLLGAAVAGGAIAALLAAVTVGLPAFKESFQAPDTTLAITLESAFMVLFVGAVVLRRGAALGVRDRAKA